MNRMTGLLLVAVASLAMSVQTPTAGAREAPEAAAARDTLQRYSQALESLDADAVKKVQPSIDVEALKRAFREMRTLQVDIDDVRVLSTEGSLMRASCRVTQTLTTKAGVKQMTVTVTRVMRLRRQAGQWVIDSFER